jgi:hypothetical protein
MRWRATLAALAVWALTPETASADPISVAILSALGYSSAAGLLAPTAVLLSLVGNAVLAALPSILLNVALAVGAAYLSGAFNPRNTDANTPSERQQTVRQSTGPRLKFYGRNMVGGQLTFFETNVGALYSQVVHNHGEIGGVVQYWLADKPVTVGGDGYVDDVQYNNPGSGQQAGPGADLVKILHKPGSPDETAYSDLLAAFPSVYTTDHRLRGLFTTLTSYREVAAEFIAETYPQNAPSLRVVADMSKVRRVRQGDFAYSNNPGDCIYDYLVDPDGANKSASSVDLASFQAFANMCDVDYPKKGGGTVKRYIIATSYALNEQHRTVLDRMLASCDGELYITPAGKIAIRGGQWIEPTVTLDADLGHIINGEWQQGAGALAAFNRLAIVYTEPGLEYSEAEGQAWIDAANVALRGKILNSQIGLTAVPVHAQARRLAKIATHKANPLWTGTLTTNFYGLDCIGEQIIRIKFPELGIDTTFSIQKLEFLPDFTGVRLTVASLTSAAYSWDAELEEGNGPTEPESTETPVDLSAPDDIVPVALERVLSGSDVGVYIRVDWTPLSRPALLVEVQYRLSPSGGWLNMSTLSGEPAAESGLVDSGETYDIRVRTVSPAGVAGDWEDITGFVATP